MHVASMKGNPACSTTCNACKMAHILASPAGNGSGSGSDSDDAPDSGKNAPSPRNAPHSGTEAAEAAVAAADGGGSGAAREDWMTKPMQHTKAEVPEADQAAEESAEQPKARSIHSISQHILKFIRHGTQRIL